MYYGVYLAYDFVIFCAIYELMMAEGEVQLELGRAWTSLNQTFLNQDIENI